VSHLSPASPDRIRNFCLRCSDTKALSYGPGAPFLGVTPSAYWRKSSTWRLHPIYFFLPARLPAFVGCEFIAVASCLLVPNMLFTVNKGAPFRRW
jgi:hypothetical protein